MSEEDRLHRRKKGNDAELAANSETGSQRKGDAAASGTVSSDAGIRSMAERLEFLRAELAKWTATQERFPARAEDMNRRITELQAAIADTEAWLAEYRKRRDGKH